jgi:hypothetical protein
MAKVEVKSNSDRLLVYFSTLISLAFLVPGTYYLVSRGAEAEGLPAFAIGTAIGAIAVQPGRLKFMAVPLFLGAYTWMLALTPLNHHPTGGNLMGLVTGLGCGAAAALALWIGLKGEAGYRAKFDKGENS